MATKTPPNCQMIYFTIDRALMKELAEIHMDLRRGLVTEAEMLRMHLRETVEQHRKKNAGRK